MASVAKDCSSLPGKAVPPSGTPPLATTPLASPDTTPPASPRTVPHTLPGDDFFKRFAALTRRIDSSTPPDEVAATFSFLNERNPAVAAVNEALSKLFKAKVNCLNLASVRTCLRTSDFLRPLMMPDDELAKKRSFLEARYASAYKKYFESGLTDDADLKDLDILWKKTLGTNCVASLQELIQQAKHLVDSAKPPVSEERKLNEIRWLLRSWQLPEQALEIHFEWVLRGS